MNKVQLRSLMIKESIRQSKNPPANSKLSRLGRQYADLMGYKSVGLGKWQTKSGRIFTTKEIGLKLPSLNFLNKRGGLNVNEVKRVNKGCVLNQNQLIIGA